VFSAQETNFFPSEGCCFHWASEEQPDFIVFGFTMCHVAMIIGEALEIPIVAFLLQPDHKIEERNDITTYLDKLMAPARQAMNSKGFNAVMTQIMERASPSGITLNQLRRTRGLRSCPSGLTDSMRHYDECHRFQVPMIAPINPIALGDYAKDMPHYCFTSFLYLRQGADALDPE
ncbi:unnamed protein product, partial [Polarella glacialis]